MPDRFYTEWGRFLYLVENTATYTFILVLLVWTPPTIVISTIGFGSVLTTVLAFNPDSWYYVWTFLTHGFYHENLVILGITIPLLYYLYPLETLIGEVRYYRVIVGSILISAIIHLVGSMFLYPSHAMSGSLPLVVGLVGMYAGCLPFDDMKIMNVNTPFITFPIILGIGLVVSIVLNGVVLFGQSQLSILGTLIFGVVYGYYVQYHNDIVFDDEYLPDEVPWDVPEHIKDND